jgi:hypothetical protein
MSCRSVLGVFAEARPYTLVVEPWAEEFPIEVGEKYRVVALHPEVMPTSQSKGPSTLLSSG